MATQTFVDTMFVLALINTRDQWHAQAQILADQLTGTPLVTTDSVLLEIGNALARSYKAEAITIINDFLTADEVDIVRLTPELFDRGWTLYQHHYDKPWGLVDCISFIVMRDRHLVDAATGDQHFIQAGFHALMRDLPPTR